MISILNPSIQWEPPCSHVTHIANPSWWTCSYLDYTNNSGRNIYNNYGNSNINSNISSSCGNFSFNLPCPTTHYPDKFPLTHRGNNLHLAPDFLHNILLPCTRKSSLVCHSSQRRLSNFSNTPQTKFQGVTFSSESSHFGANKISTSASTSDSLFFGFVKKARSTNIESGTETNRPGTETNRPVSIQPPALFAGSLATTTAFYPDPSQVRVNFLLVYVSLFLFSLYALVLLIVALDIGMGNEGSVQSSNASTPISDYASLYSIHSRVRSSVESTRAASPMEAPEPDLSHLTPDEIAQIRSVMERAKTLQNDEQQRVRKMEEDYVDFASSIQRHSMNLHESDRETTTVCPICNKNTLAFNLDGSRSSMHVCVDCEKMTCPECGDQHVNPSKMDTPLTSSMDTSLTSNGSMASSRGSSRESRDDSGFRDVSRGSHEDVADDEDLTNNSGGRGDSLGMGSRCGGDSGLAVDIGNLTLASSQNTELARQVYEQSRVKGPGATLPQSESDDFSDMASDLDFDELASERSRPDGGSSTDDNGRDTQPGSVSNVKQTKRHKHRPRSLRLTRSVSHTSSDEEEGEGGRHGKIGGGEGGGGGGVGSEGLRLENENVEESKSRTSYSLSVSCHSSKDCKGLIYSSVSGKVKYLLPSSSGCEKSTTAGPSPSLSSSSLLLSSSSDPSRQPLSSSQSQPSSSSTHTGKAKTKQGPPPKLSLSGQQQPPPKAQNMYLTQDLVEGQVVNSPTPPRSPSWREGLDSPPFSPKRRDSYPGKRRGSLSPKDKKSHFTYTDISPPSRQLSMDEFCGEAAGTCDRNALVSSQVPLRPSPKSPDQIKDSIITTMGETLPFDMSLSRNKNSTNSSPMSSQLHDADDYPTGPLPHSAPLMDLATYAATIANSTASLTSMSVSPTNLLPHASQGSSGDGVSPDSIESADSSSSPVSPGYYDNATPSSEESDEVELADPSSKSIDFQGSKRQKARPPSTDWSPVIDLSPILDVSPSVEEAEQQDMLAKQREEHERQLSREEEECDEDDDEDEEESVNGRTSNVISFSDKRHNNDCTHNQVIPRIPPPPSSKLLKQKLYEEEHDDDKDNDHDNDKCLFVYNGLLRRVGNSEDISQLDSEFNISKPMEITPEERIPQDVDLHDISGDLPFFSCTSQAQTLPHSSPCISFSGGSAFQPTGKQMDFDSSVGKQHKDFESLISDEIHKIAEDMENITKRGVADIRPVPPPKPKRRLPDPELALHTSSQPTVTSSSTSSRPIPVIRTEESVIPSAVSPKDSSGATTSSSETGKYLPRQDSAEKKKAKDMKAKPSPLLIQHIEAEEQSVSPHYKVMESPPTPEMKTIKREFSDSTSVSTSSSPDQDVYNFPSPVTPPDSDSSPPKPHSPNDVELDKLQKSQDMIQSSSFRSLSPYDNAMFDIKEEFHTHAPPDSSKIEIVDMHTRSNINQEQPQPRNMVRPPISPRKSLKRLEDQRLNGGLSPNYENLRDTAVDASTGDMDYSRKSSLTMRDELIETNSSNMSKHSVLTDVTDHLPQQRTEIFTYPVIGDYSANDSSSHVWSSVSTLPSATTATVQSSSTGTFSVINSSSTVRTATATGLPAHDSGNDTQGYAHHQDDVDSGQQRPTPPRPPPVAKRQTSGEETASVRDKIKAFEEITSNPTKNVSPPRESKRDPRREAFVNQNRRADSNSSTSSSTSSKFSTSSDMGKSQEKEPGPASGNKEGKKVRRKLPPIPVGEEPVLAPKSKGRRPKPPPKRDQTWNRSEEPRTGPRVIHVLDSSDPEPAYFIGPTNRVTSHVTSYSDDSMNEDDLEVARLTTKVKGHSSKPTLSNTGKSKSFDSADSYHQRLEKDERTKPPMQRTASLSQGPKNETDEIIDALINIYDIPCTEAMKCLKKKLQEELRRVTRDRKRKLEELEEIRALQMQIGALNLESDSYARSRGYAGKRSPAQQHLNMDTSQQQDNRKRGSNPSPSSSLTPRSSPQVTPRRQRHKRQSSDPMISKFSPIKEDRDIETDFQTRIHEQAESRVTKYHTDDSSQSGISDTESTRSEPVRESSRHKKVKEPDYVNINAFTNQSKIMSGSADRLQYSDYEQKRADRNQAMSGSRSEQHLSSNGRATSSSSYYYPDDPESTIRAEKKALLQYEIMKRKQQLEETARLKNELLKLARARQSLVHSYDDIPRQYSAAASSKHRPVPRGIIKPIDDTSQPVYDRIPGGSRHRSKSRDRSGSRSRDRSRESLSERDLTYDPAREDPLLHVMQPEQRNIEAHGSPRHRLHRIPQKSQQQPFPQQSGHPHQHHHHIPQQHQQMQQHDRKVLSNYSSTEYLAHKQESASRRYVDDPSAYGHPSAWVNGDYDTEDIGPAQAHSQPTLNVRTDSAQSLVAARREAAKKDPVISSSVTLPNIYGNKADVGFRPPYRDATYVSTSISDTDGSPASDITPAMPLLDDVKAKSRTIIRNIGSGSRPVSAEFSAGEVEDLLNAMYRVESDNSVDADEPIMKHMTEGGVTILKQIDRKRRPAPVEPHRYNFPVKRILVTRDPKERSISGNGLGIKIVGGKEIPGTTDTGAYVTAIYPGIIADQLHGELDVGDQVLEWNGIHLTGLTSRDVQDIINHTNGEIEMVVKVQTMPIPLTTLVAQPDSCRSSYDNLPSYDDSVKEHQHPPMPKQRTVSSQSSIRYGVDPHQLAAQLEGIREAASPAENSPSSSHQDMATPSVSSPCSTPRSDPTSTSSDRQLCPTSSTVQGDRTDRPNDGRGSDRQSGRRRRRQSPNTDKSEHQPQRSSPHHPPRQHHSHGSSSQQQPLENPSHPQQQQQQQQQHPQKQQYDYPASSPTPAGPSDQPRSSSGHHHHHHHHHHHRPPHHQSRQHQQQQPQQHQQQQHNRDRHSPTPHSHQHRQDQEPQPHQSLQTQEESFPDPVQQPPRRKADRRKSSQQKQPLQQEQQQQQQQHQEQQNQQQYPPEPQQEPSNQPNIAASEKPRPMKGFDQTDDASCSSPAMNDRLRASPPLDSRRSVKYRGSKKTKDSVIAYPKPVPTQNEKGEDFGLGEIQIQISHDDFDNTLNLHIIQARNLRPRDLNGLSDPFVKVYLLPGRGPENKRRTKQISRTLNPEWHQTVMFQDVARLELQNKVLEITVWDYDRFKANDFLGELIIELREFAFLDNKPHWYPLKEHKAINSFELPKSTVSPPKPAAETSKLKSRSPRHGKKHGVSSLRPQDSQDNEVEGVCRRRSLGALTGSDTVEASSSNQREISSATSSPIAGRRQHDTKSPIKTKSNGLLYR